MTEQETLFVKLAAIGGIIGLAKLLVDDKEEITFRVLIGRIILGAAISLTSGVALIHMTNLNELGLIGIACSLGISGQTCIEWLLKRGKKKNDVE